MFCAFKIQYLLFYSSCQTSDQTSSQKGGYAIGQIISYQCLRVESWVQSQASVCGMCDGQSGTEVSHWVLWCTLSLSFHQCCILIHVFVTNAV